MRRRLKYPLLFGVVAGLTLSGCAKDSSTSEPTHCAPDTLEPNSGPDQGKASVFILDPMVASGRTNLSPSSSQLDQYTSPVALKRLGGHGVLEGDYVEVRNGRSCGGWFGAHEPSGTFSYPHSDARFQEAMAYYWGDAYRANLSDVGYLQEGDPVRVVAHCGRQDNAFFVRGKDKQGNTIEQVCLGDSVATNGASYADDAVVTVHELQHATTTAWYSPTSDLNRFVYDEAGALNEAVSDFMALVFEQPWLPASFDPRLFSRWALGAFMPGRVGYRGAHKCPAYDPTYPNCGSFPAFSADNNTISYVYPDGLGWPYADNFQGPGKAADAFGSYKAQEEIHNAAVLLEGALWDAYENLKIARGGDQAQAASLISKLVLESVRHLPKPTDSELSPVTFRAMASAMSVYGASVGLSTADQSAVDAALTARGLLGGVGPGPGWLSVGPGTAGVAPGLRIQDDPALLKSWVVEMFGSIAAAQKVTQTGATANGKLDAGELTAVWFDLRDDDARSAGGIQVTVTALDPDAVTFEQALNVGAIGTGNTLAQIQYGKVYGTGAVTALTSTNATLNVGASNSYFRTNPFFWNGFNTALWVRVNAGTAHGRVVRFLVEATPSNGSTASTTFSATVN